MKTYMQRKEDVKRKWHLLDARDKILGRLATQAATLITGKHKPTYTPHTDGGDYVVIINAEKIKLTAKKDEKKIYKWHTMYPGGIKEETFKNMMKKNPKKVIWLAIDGMLPKTKLGEKMRKRVKIFVGDKHPYTGVINN